MNALTITKALADDTRLRILNLLLVHELSVGEVVEALGLGQPRVSRHLGILAEAGLAVPRREGSWAFYSAAANGLARPVLEAMRPLLSAAPEAVADLEAAARVVAERGSRSRRFFNAVAEEWDAMRGEILGGFDLAAAIVARLPAAGPAADLGCGAGALIPALVRHAGSAIGVDNSPRMLDVARRRFEGDTRVSLRMGEIEHLPLRDGEAAAAVLSMALHHLPRPEAGIAEALRVVRPGGVLVVAELDRHEREDMRTRFGDQWLGIPEATITAWLAAAGFTDIRADRHPLSGGLRIVIFTATRPQPRPGAA